MGYGINHRFIRPDRRCRGLRDQGPGQALSGGDKISMGGSTARVGDIGIRPHDFEIQDDTLGLCAHQMALSQPLASATAGVQGMIWWS